MQCFHAFANMWTVNTNYKNIFPPTFSKRLFKEYAKDFQGVSKVFPHSQAFQRVSKEFQSISKGFQKGFKAFQNGFQRVSKRFKRVSKGFQKCFQRVSKAFPKGFKPSETRFQKGFRVTSNPLKNAFVDKMCFRMEGHI